MNDTTTPEFFEAKYQRDSDPWNFHSSEYEQRRYSSIISMLAGTIYRRAFEPGCSIGVLTAKLAPLCNELIAIDVAPTAVESAALLCSPYPHIDIRVGSLPASIPDGSFDLILFSEIGYYFEELQLAAVGKLLVSRLENHGVLLAAHWLGHSDDHLLSGERVHQVLARLDGLHLKHTERHQGFHLHKWVRA